MSSKSHTVSDTIPRRNWWKTQFTTDYYNTYLPHLTADRTKREIEAIIRITSATKNDSILDLACGFGRHAIELARRGFMVTATDYSPLFLAKAKKDALKHHLLITFREEDMRSLHENMRYSLILSLFTSFGYFPHKENLDVLRRIYSALAPGGKLFLDVMNADLLFHDILQDGTRVTPTVIQRMKIYEANRVLYTDIDYLHQNTGVVRLFRKWESGNKNGGYHYYITHYTAKQYNRFLTSIGFSISTIFGDYDGTPWSLNSPRTIVLAQKP